MYSVGLWVPDLDPAYCSRDTRTRLILRAAYWMGPWCATDTYGTYREGVPKSAMSSVFLVWRKFIFSDTFLLMQKNTSYI